MSVVCALEYVVLAVASCATARCLASVARGGDARHAAAGAALLAGVATACFVALPLVGHA